MSPTQVIFIYKANQYHDLLSRDGEYASIAELQCISELYPNLLFWVPRDVGGKTVTYEFGSGNVVCDLLFSWHVDSGHFSVLKSIADFQDSNGALKKKKKEKGHWLEGKSKNGKNGVQWQKCRER